MNLCHIRGGIWRGIKNRLFTCRLPYCPAEPPPPLSGLRSLFWPHHPSVANSGSWLPSPSTDGTVVVHGGVGFLLTGPIRLLRAPRAAGPEEEHWRLRRRREGQRLCGSGLGLAVCTKLTSHITSSDPRHFQTNQSPSPAVPGTPGKQSRDGAWLKGWRAGTCQGLALSSARAPQPASTLSPPQTARGNAPWEG